MTLSVTERAAEALHETLDSMAHEPQQVLRLVSRDEGFTLAVEEPGDDDEVISHNGTAVLAVERQVTSQLDGLTMDVDESSPEGGRLTLKR